MFVSFAPTLQCNADRLKLKQGSFVVLLKPPVIFFASVLFMLTLSIGYLLFNLLESNITPCIYATLLILHNFAVYERSNKQ